MPLKRTIKRMTPKKKREVVSTNIRREIEVGRPQKQAIAIALSKQREDLGKKRRLRTKKEERGSRANLRSPFKRIVDASKRRKRLFSGRV